MIGDRNTCCTSVTIFFLINLSTAVQCWKRLDFVETFWFRALAIGRSPLSGVNHRVFSGCEYMTCMVQIVLCGHSERDVAVPASSKVQLHG